MEVYEKKRRTRLLIVAITAFGCSVAALSGTLAASTYGDLAEVHAERVGFL